LDATTNLFGDDQDVLALYNIVRGAKKWSWPWMKKVINT
jgi:hypothetical protein